LWKYKLAGIISIASLFLLPFLIGNSKAEYTVLEFPDSFKNIIITFFPQGWRFFTKNPRGMYLSAIYPKEKPNESFDFHSIFKRKYWGFSRYSRALKWELQPLLEHLEEKDFSEDPQKAWNNCLDFNPKLKHLFSAPFYILESEEQAAWHWRKNLNSSSKKRWLCLKRI
jgi:hypothetical protein